jgi:hypothetical protein
MRRFSLLPQFGAMLPHCTNDCANVFPDAQLRDISALA